MISMNRAPSPAELGGVLSLIDFIVALQKDPTAFAAVIQPLLDAHAANAAQQAEIVAQATAAADAEGL